MPGPHIDPAALAAEHRQLDSAAAEHKRAARRHKDGLKAVRTRQAEIERVCARLGIQLTEHPGEGGIHGRRSNPQS
ncbi:hypothetical protein C7435_0008 [Maricaulis maris]|uniref:Uncharacterized protein n=1 Tax=Maricaulis maris TaxID=74318 RepID=A0A495DKV4_9PROT|nr:hypothetical protein C7435_0008 [Maricaulis maris]